MTSLSTAPIYPRGILESHKRIYTFKFKKYRADIAGAVLVSEN